MAGHGKVWRVGICIAVGGFLFGYNIGIFNVTQESVAHTLEWGNNDQLFISLATFIMLAGGLIGALLSGSTATHKGRRWSLIMGDLICLGGAGLTAIPTTITFFIGRFALGMAIGVYQTVCPLYINEISPPSLSGKIGGLFVFSLLSGLAIAFALSLALPEELDNPMNDWWLFMFGWQGLIALFQLIVFLTILKLDTPYWYVKRGEYEKTQLALTELRRTDVISSLVNREEQEAFAYRITCREIFCSRRYSKMTRVGAIILTSPTLAGIIFFDSFSTFIFHEIGYTLFLSRLFTLIIGGIGILGAILYILLISKMRRRTIVKTSLLLFSGIFTAMAIFVGFIDLPVVVIILSAFYKLIMNCALAPVSFVIAAEVLDSNELGVLVASSWIIKAVVGLGSLYAVEHLTLAGNLLLYSVFVLAIAIYMHFDMLESKDLSREDIRKLYVGGQRIHSEEREMANGIHFETHRSENAEILDSNK